VAIGPGVFVAGAYGDLYLEGTARVFRREGSNWTLQTVLNSGEVNGENVFGSAASIDGGWLVIGDPFFSFGGAIYVYRVKDGHVIFDQTIAAPSGAAADLFGEHVDVSGEAIVVGEPAHKTLGLSGAGAAYVYRRVDSDWSEEVQLIAPAPMPNDSFGSDVAIANDVAVVGALGVNGSSTTTGAVFVYRRTRGVWGLEQQLTPSDPAPGSKCFGEAIAVDGVAQSFCFEPVDGVKRVDFKILANNGSPNYTGVAEVAFDSHGRDTSSGDLNCDLLVNATDLAILLGAWGPCVGDCPTTHCNADINGDCQVDAADLAWKGLSFTKRVQPRRSSAAAASRVSASTLIPSPTARRIQRSGVTRPVEQMRRVSVARSLPRRCERI